MRPYSVEIFDKNMDFQFNALIEKLDFKTDAVSQVKNTFKITKNFKPSSDPRGWYVKITRYNGTQEFSYNDNYEGVITAFEEGEDFMAIYGHSPILPDGSKNPEFTLHGGNVESYDDHRVAMSLACFGLGLKEGESVIINDAECCSVSFPGFFEKMNDLGAGFQSL